ncbi:hypothetical protein ACHAW5_007816 [Stephanodiscus triporus]|uniref:Uncharacterized protein n=1 Tax=Stephanodiscus triporus TaxID=2934178 RepID=A0ABD3NP87_9STRA
MGMHSTTGSSAGRKLCDISVRERNSVSQEHDHGGNKGLELWLDLRCTSLTPKTALELWDLEEHRGNDYCAERINAPFVKCLVSSTGTSFVSPFQISEDEMNQNIDVLLVAEGADDEDMPFIFQQPNPSMMSSTKSVCIGRLLSLRASSSMPLLPDPLPAMEVAFNGQWIVVDTDGWKKIEEEERLRMALPLLELISSSAARSSGRGGIGLTCHTKNEVVKAVMFIQSMTNGGGSDGRQVRTKTLRSGIVILEDDIAITSEWPSAIESKAHHFAIVVPFDMELLRTAKLLFAEKDICEHESARES